MDRLNNTKEEIVDKIIQDAWNLIGLELRNYGIEHDAGSTDVIFYNDEKQKKTFAINLFQHKCDVYEGV